VEHLSYHPASRHVFQVASLSVYCSLVFYLVGMNFVDMPVVADYYFVLVAEDANLVFVKADMRQVQAYPLQ
jgi:hypothetical protein